MSTLKLHAISFSRPTTLHNAQRLQRCRSTATKISAGNRSVLITRPQRHVVTSSLRREEATIATGMSYQTNQVQCMLSIPTAYFK
eukprot:3495802-Pyramimonas_sp.AAC.1